MEQSKIRYVTVVKNAAEDQIGEAGEITHAAAVSGVENVHSLQESLITLLQEDRTLVPSDHIHYIKNSDSSDLSHGVELQQIVGDVTNEVEVTTGEMEVGEVQEVEVVDTGHLGGHFINTGHQEGNLINTVQQATANYVIDGGAILDIIEEVTSDPQVNTATFTEPNPIYQIEGLSSIKTEIKQDTGDSIVHVRKYDKEEVTFHIYPSHNDANASSKVEDSQSASSTYIKGMFTCTECQQTFAKQSSLKLHKRLHYNPSKCKTCGKCFAQASQLRAHEVVHSGSRPYKCDVCNKAFHYSSTLLTHQRIHSQEKPFKCPHCDKSFLQSSNLTSHLMKHVGEDESQRQQRLRCEECGLDFESRELWTGHMEGHQLTGDSGDSENKGFVCTICGKSFKNKKYEAVHMLSHEETTPIECEKCGKTVKNQKTLASHMAAVHSEEASHMCEACGKMYTSRHSLRQHMKIHTSEYRAAKAKWKEIVRHAKEEDKKEKVKLPKKIHHCSQCYKTFTEKRHLTDHMLIHAGRKDHVCSVCGRGFRQKSTLTRHMKVHTGEKKYECGECGRAFREMSNVKDHQLAVHLKIRPHTCQVCGKSFSLPLTLKKHLLTHTDDKEWFCFDCGKAFKCQQHLKNHKLVHSEDRKTYQCEYCLGLFKRPVCLKKHLQRCAGVPADSE